MSIKCGVSLKLSFILLSHLWCQILYYCVPPCIDSDSTFSGVCSSSSYATMGVGFEFCLYIGAGVFCLQEIFALEYVEVLDGLICLTYTLVCDVSLWGVSCVVLFRMLFPTLGNKNRSSRSYVVCLKLSSKLRIDCNLLAPMDANGAVSDGF